MQKKYGAQEGDKDWLSFVYFAIFALAVQRFSLGCCGENRMWNPELTGYYEGVCLAAKVLLS